MKKEITQSELIELHTRSICLIAKPNTNVPNCHENHYCRCDIDKLSNHIHLLEQQITNLKKQIEILEESNTRIRRESFFLLSAEDGECNFHESSTRRNKREKYLKELREGSEE